MLDWFAEESRRTYGRVIPARSEGVLNLVLKEPVGPVAAFTPWNFPVSQAARKLGAALSAGCSVILKPAEETPGSPAELVRALADAGLPPGVVNLVYGDPSEISDYLIPHPVIRKVSFTGSTPIGKRLAALAGQHMKRITMELGGHAPAIVFDDADLTTAATVLAAGKYRNAGQVCIAPTRFLVQDASLRPFPRKFRRENQATEGGQWCGRKVRPSDLSPTSAGRPHSRPLVEDAVQRGASVLVGGRRQQNKGYFFEPTVLTDVPRDARAMNEEPFGPLALVSRFKDFDEALRRSQSGCRTDWRPTHTRARSAPRRLWPKGSKAECCPSTIMASRCRKRRSEASRTSGFGSEGGSEAVEAYLATKFVSQGSPAGTSPQRGSEQFHGSSQSPNRPEAARSETSGSSNLPESARVRSAPCCLSDMGADVVTVARPGQGRQAEGDLSNGEDAVVELDLKYRGSQGLRRGARRMCPIF